MVLAVSRILNEISSFKFKAPNYIETPGQYQLPTPEDYKQI
jgi:hypothetical protein